MNFLTNRYQLSTSVRLAFQARQHVQHNILIAHHLAEYFGGVKNIFHEHIQWRTLFFSYESCFMFRADGRSRICWCHNECYATNCFLELGPHWWYLSAWQCQTTYFKSLPRCSAAKLVFMSYQCQDDWQIYPQWNISGIPWNPPPQHYRNWAWLYRMNGKHSPKAPFKIVLPPCVVV